VGVDESDPDTPLGRWKTVRRGDREIWFLPVARIDITRPKAGSDTGGLVQQGVSGFVCGRSPGELAHSIRAARHLDRAKVVDAAAALSAPRVVREIFFDGSY
jgi:hypothetical protein